MPKSRRTAPTPGHLAEANKQKLMETGSRPEASHGLATSPQFSRIYMRTLPLCWSMGHLGKNKEGKETLGEQAFTQRRLNALNIQFFKIRMYWNTLIDKFTLFSLLDRGWGLMRKYISVIVLVFYCCHDNLPHTWWLKTAQICYLKVLRVRNPTWVSQS